MKTEEDYEFMGCVPAILRIIFIFGLSLGSFSQPLPPIQSPIPEPSFGPGGPIGASLNDGLWLALGMAIGYGIYKMASLLRKKSKNYPVFWHCPDCDKEYPIDKIINHKCK